MFIDIVKIYVKAGDGGNGAISFHREKYVPAGGPDGGDGGRGGNIIFRVDEGANTLLSFRYKRKFVAENGQNGMGRKFHGKNGADVVISVPPGTLLKDPETGKIIFDMSRDREYVACRGGRGGWGNRHFATSTRQIPRFAKSGTKGEEKEIQLELKMLADVGLLGFPNVGKSSLLSRISAARPKIADYHFTTLSPNLGVVSLGEGGHGFTVADIPGLIEGASDGLGLGHAFLRHVDRCRLLLHLVDISASEGRDPIEDLTIINNELARYSEDLANRPQIVVGNKMDMTDLSSPEVQAFENHCKGLGYEVFYISAATGEGIKPLMEYVGEKLRDLPPITVYEAEYTPEEAAVSGSGAIETTIRVEDGVYYVEGRWLENFMGQINFSDYESLNFFQRVLEKNGVFTLLREAGIQDEDTVNIYDFEFQFVN